MTDPAPPPGARERAIALVPRALVLLGIACSISGIGGFVWMISGGGPLPLGVLLVPPALALAAIGWWGARELQPEHTAEEER